MIPVKCFTCGNVLADKYIYFKNETENKLVKDTHIKKDEFNKTIIGDTLDTLGLFSVCCRRHMLTHVEIE